jgi:autotransporter-associated beta strand protein
MELAEGAAFSGPVEVKEGTLVIQSSTSLGTTASGTHVFPGATLELSPTGSQPIAIGGETLNVGGNGLASAGAVHNVSGQNSWAGPVSFNTLSTTFNVDQDTLTFSNTMTGTGALVKEGAGTLTLSGSSKAYTGSTTVNTGNLRLNTTLASPVTNVAGTISGHGGTLQTLNVLQGGLLSPGNGGSFNGQLTVNGDLGLDPNVIYAVDINAAGNDRMVVRDGAALAGAQLVVRTNFASTVGNTYTILSKGGRAPAAGNFRLRDGTPLLEGTLFSPVFGGPRYRISYVGGDGNDVVVTHVKSPALFPNRTVTAEIDEGESVTLSGTVSDPDARDRFTLLVDWGDGSPLTRRVYGRRFNGTQVELKHRYAADGDYTLQLSWNDQHGEGNAGTLTTHVRNVAPTLTSSPPPSTHILARSGAPLRARLRVADPGGGDAWTLVADYGDGTAPDQRTGARPGRVSLSHTYDLPGEYVLGITLQDDDGAITTADFQVTVS